MGPLQRANISQSIFLREEWVALSFPSPDAGNRSSFRNVLFSTYLEFRTMDKGHKPSDSGTMADLIFQFTESLERA
jgi:hypothetical protein